MQFPVSWLREFCDPPIDNTGLAEILTMGGMEVEDTHTVAPPFQGVVVAYIVALDKHPNADRLRVCTVDIGASEPLQIVCGAINARIGIRVPCALIGAELPVSDEDVKPLRIRVGKLRGIESFGMLCSAKELGIADDTDGLLELPGDAPIGQDIRTFLDLDDTVFTLKLTPNLGHALSVYGVARELAALTNTPLSPLPSAGVAVTQERSVAVHIRAPNLCGRFSGRTVVGITQTVKTPLWMVQRLMRCGQRSVSPLVDISNYVMFERGQPTHIFDADCIAGALHVRWAREQETLELLNGNTVTLASDVGVIADDEKIESLAGIMGGKTSAVSAGTHNIYIEAAFWWPNSIAGRARRFNFSTDAGYRFERGVDPQQSAGAIDRITDLVQQICGGQAGPLQDRRVNIPAEKTIALRVARAGRVIGMDLSLEQCKTTLERLNFAVECTHDGGSIANGGRGGGLLQVKVPSYRFDLNSEEDLIEEVVRLIGYDQLEVHAPKALLLARVPSERKKGAYALRRQLAQLGYFETISFSFVSDTWEAQLHGNADPIQLLNPIASQINVLRSSLIGSLLQTLQHNLDRKAGVVRIFEIGRVFLRNPETTNTHGSVAGIEQPMRVAALLYGDFEGLAWYKKKQPASFYDAKGDVEALLWPRQATFVAAMDAIEHSALHPGRAAQIVLDGAVIGHVGELHPRHVQEWGFSQAPLLFELDLQPCLQLDLPQAELVGKFQSVQRDTAILLQQKTPYAMVEQAAWQADTQGFLRKVELFDVYQPPTETEAGAKDSSEKTPRKSFTIRLTLASLETTLTDAQIDAVVKKVLASISEKTGAKLRT